MLYDDFVGPGSEVHEDDFFFVRFLQDTWSQVLFKDVMALRR